MAVLYLRHTIWGLFKFGYLVVLFFFLSNMYYYSDNASVYSLAKSRSLP